MKTLLMGITLVVGAQSGVAGAVSSSSGLAPAAQITEPPSRSKQLLIKQFLTLIGLQDKLDTGSFLDRYAMPGGPLWKAKSGESLTESIGDGFKIRSEALKAAYAKRKAIYQQAYEDHLNWEFTEAELQQIVAFLSKPAGQHYLHGRWRMEAYTNTNTEDMEAEIISEAASTLSK
jgi:hypothetical protein